MTRYAAITGWGMHVPDRVVTNNDLARMVDTSDEWIRSRTGIHQRYMADAKEATSDLAIRAAWQALARADLDPSHLDLVIVATCSPDYHLPSTASRVQDALGATRAGAFDLNAACSGFVYGLSVATQMIAGGAYQNALVIGAETLSRWLDWDDRNTCVLFGDGAGAVVLQASDEPSGLLSYVLGSDGSGGELLILRNGGSRNPPRGVFPNTGLTMDGKEVYRFATRIMGRAAKEALEKAGLTTDDINLFIPHQANLRIIESAAKQLAVSMDKVFVNVHKYGNTSAASIPIALCEAAEEGRLQHGDNICLVGFGAGLTWAAAAIKWAPPVNVPADNISHRLSRWSRGPLARARSLLHRAERRLYAIEEQWDRRDALASRLRREPTHADSNGAGHLNGSTNGHADHSPNGKAKGEAIGAKDGETKK